MPAPLADAITWALADQARATARPPPSSRQALEAFIKASPELATPMQLGAWVRSRFPREAMTGPQQALLLDPAAGPATMAVPGTVGGGTAGAGDRDGAGDVRDPGGSSPTTCPRRSRSPAIRMPGWRRSSSRTKARPLSKRITARQLPMVSDDRSLRAALESTKRDPAAVVADRPTLLAGAGAPTVLNPPASAGPGGRASPSVINPSALAGSGPRAQPHVINPSALAGSGPRAQPIDATLHDPPVEIASTLRSAPRTFAPAPGSQPRALDPRLAAPVLTGTEAMAGVRARVPRRLALFGGLAAIAVGSFLLALVVCSPPRTAAAPDAALVAEAADARPAGAPADAAADPTAGDGAPVPTIRPTRRSGFSSTRSTRRPSGGTVQIGDQTRATPARVHAAARHGTP